MTTTRDKSRQEPQARRAGQDRTESNEPAGPGKKHVPFAQDKGGERGIDEHDAGGQGLSG